MSTEKAIHSITDRYFRVSLITDIVTPARSYDAESGRRPGLAVQIARNGIVCRAKDVIELLFCISGFSVDLLQYANDEPTTFATAVSFLADTGRIVADHPLFDGIGVSREELRSEYLPRCEPPFLVWFEVPIVAGQSKVVRRSLRLGL